MIYITYVAPTSANNSPDLSFEFRRFHFLPKSLPLSLLSPARNWQNKLPPKEFPRGSPRHYNSRDRRRFYRAALNQNVQPFSPYVPRGGDQVAVERPRDNSLEL